ncbi:hypothetical protein JG687_00010439 [Phytophthora cactorum]|uniref:DUF7769 domain-containing protein n=1 Tax=Phytophthora cactorum TaxID=29920 RepID=A0A8T1UB39_9STRA|nr:hypothetical protein JG687_00010439 [Phytophthora cactorum]
MNPLAAFSLSTALVPTPNQPANPARAKRNLTDHDHQDVVLFLFERSIGGALSDGDLGTVAAHFSVSIPTVERVWKRFKDAWKTVGIVGVNSKIPEYSGRKKIDHSTVLAQVPPVPLRRRGNQRSHTKELGLPRAAVQAALIDGLLCRHSTRNCPLLTDVNKKTRMRFALKHVSRDPTGLIFSSMHNVVYLDEKWFNEDKDNRTVYGLPGEALPLRRRKSKRFIGKTMFLAAVARSRHDSNGQVGFDVKIGIWDFTRQKVALRNSVNRSEGTLETKNLDTVDRSVYKR